MKTLSSPPSERFPLSTPPQVVIDGHHAAFTERKPSAAGQVAHTPENIPWHIEPGDSHSFAHPAIFAADGKTKIADFLHQPEAEFAVTACNSHARLLSEREKLRGALMATLGQCYLYKALLNENELDAKSPQLKAAIAGAIVTAQTACTLGARALDSNANT